MDDETVDGVRAVILAGGAGTRVAHLLPGLPKPMAMIMGRPFLDWVVLHLLTRGFKSISVSTGHLGEIIEKHLAVTHFEGTTITCTRETAPRGTAGGFLNAVQTVPVSADGYLVVNGDSLVLADPRELVQTARQGKWDAALFGLWMVDARRYGVLDVDAGALLRGFHEKGAASGVVNVGVYWIGRDCLARFPARNPLSFEHDVFPAMIAAGARVGVVTVEVPFTDIGTPASLREAEAFVAAHLAPEPARQGAS